MDFNQYARNLWENTSEQRESIVREERILKKINRKIFWGGGSAKNLRGSGLCCCLCGCPRADFHI